MTEKNKPRVGASDNKQGNVKPEHAASASVSTPAADQTKRGHKTGKTSQPGGSSKNNVTEKISLGEKMQRQKPSRIGLWVAGLALLIACAGIYWSWQQNLTARSAEQLRLQQAQQLVEMQETVTALQQKFSTIGEMQQSQWQSFQQQQVRELESIQRQLSQSRDPNWLLAEAEYLIRIASYRLQLAHDVDTALGALILADQRLQVLRDPRLVNVRRQLSNDITRLKAVPHVDITGMSLTLSSLQQQLEQLPLTGQKIAGATGNNQTKETRDSDKKDWSQFINDVWVSLKSLVIIRRVDETSVAFVAPEQRGFLYQNLALKLEVVRQALLRSDDALYHQALGIVNDWLQHYFDKQDSGVQAMSATLQQLDTIRLNPELPSLSDSLQALQSISRNKLSTVKSEQEPVVVKQQVLPQIKGEQGDLKSMDAENNGKPLNGVSATSPGQE